MECPYCGYIHIPEKRNFMNGKLVSEEIGDESFPNYQIDGTTFKHIGKQCPKCKGFFIEKFNRKQNKCSFLVDTDHLFKKTPNIKNVPFISDGKNTTLQIPIHIPADIFKVLDETKIIKILEKQLKDTCKEINSVLFDKFTKIKFKFNPLTKYS